jgi:hypothetical protein
MRYQKINKNEKKREKFLLKNPGKKIGGKEIQNLQNQTLNQLCFG